MAKCVPQKRCIETVRRVRKISERFGRRLRGVLMKKGYEKGGVSL
nr:glycosyltransferase [Capnocytophaga ochracea]